MFEAMMGQIEDDFVRYVFHLQVVVDDEPAPDLRNISYSAPEDGQGAGAASIAAAVAAAPPEEMQGGPFADPGQPLPMQDEMAQQPVRVEKTPGRNEPCFCGSGKKYKLCHGR
jgi:preprotein translocase subunit SecA